MKGGGGVERVAFAQTDTAVDRPRPRLALAIVATVAAVAAGVVANVLVDDLPWGVQLVMFLPAVVAAVATASRDPGYFAVAAILLIAWCVISAASVGVFFAPAAVIMVSAGRWRRSEGAASG